MSMFRLIALNLNVMLGLSSLKWNRRNNPKKFWGAIGLAALIIVAILPIFTGYFYLLQLVLSQAIMLGQPQVVLTMAMVLVSVLVFFFGIPYVMSVFYFSSDIRFLVPLPIPPRNILAAKFAVVLVSDYLTVLPFFLPAIIVYGMSTGAGALYWLLSVVVFLAVPIIPLAIVSILILFLMRVTNFGRKKDTLRMAGMFLIIFFVLTFNFFITTAAQGDQAELIQRLLTDPEGLVKYVTGIYPPALWVTRALSSTGIPAFFNLLYFLALSATTLLLFGLAGSRYFYRGLIGGEEVARGPKISEEALGKRLSRSTSPVYAIALREIKLLFRTPIYLFNSVALLLIIPVVLLIPAFTGGGGIGQIVEMAFAAGNRAALVLVAGAFMGGMALFTPAASSSFSREGKLFWISQVIPVSPREQIRGKILYSLMIAWLAVPLVVLFSIRTVPLTFSELVIAVLLGTALSFPAITISLLIDLLRPYLDWDNPQKPIKQNVNVLLAMVAGAGLFYAIYFLTRQVMAVGVGSFGLYLTVLLLSLVTGLIPYSILIKIADSRYRDIQV